MTLKRNLQKLLLRILIVFVFSVAITNCGWAQGPDPPDDGDPGEDPDLPIDSNVFVLVGAGVAYGLKKIQDVKQLKKKQNNLSSSENTYDDLEK